MDYVGIWGNGQGRKMIGESGSAEFEDFERGIWVGGKGKTSSGHRRGMKVGKRGEQRGKLGDK